MVLFKPSYRFANLGIICLLSLTCCLAPSAYASNYRLAHTLKPKEPLLHPHFGSSVVLEDGVAAIKSNSGYLDGDGLSSTHIFEKNGIGNDWNEVATLEYESGHSGFGSGNPYIGQELAINNGEIVIGYGKDHQILDPSYLQFATRDSTGWSFQSNVPTPQRTYSREPSSDEPLPTYLFEPLNYRNPGRSVDISGNLAIIEDGGASTARIYRKSMEGLWAEAANLPTSTYDVAIDDTTAVVTRHGSHGAPHVSFFELSMTDTWSKTISFTLNSSYPLAFVEVERDTAVVLEAVSGDLYVYERLLGDWQETLVLDSNAGGIGGLAMQEGIIAYSVGETGESPTHVNLLQKSSLGSWEVFETIYDPNPELGYQFGFSLALDKGRLLVGAPNGIEEDQPGLTYLFTQVPEPSAALLAMLASFIGGLQRRTR